MPSRLGGDGVRRPMSMEDYLRAKTDVPTGPERLYQAIVTNGNSGRLADLGIPWPTFVLGTGCLSSPEASGEPQAARRLEAVQRAAAALTPDDHGRALGALVGQFIAGIAADQKLTLGEAHSDDGGSSADSFGAERVDLVLDLILATALATRVYAAAITHFPHLLKASPYDEVRYDPAVGRWAETDFLYVQPLDTTLKRLADRTCALEAIDQVIELAKSARTGLEHNTVQRANVELFGALAWHYLTNDSATYPSWRELLLIGALAQRSVVPGEAPARPFRTNQGASFIADRLRTATNRSWEQRRSGARSDRQKFFDQVAVILSQQAAYHEHENAAGGVPLPTAFVSSFDLELEMALWARQLPFSVVIPVLSVNRQFAPNDAAFHWVWTTITPDGMRDEVPGALMAPQRWRRLDESTFRRLVRGPVVVRLAGSPLIDLQPSFAVTLQDLGDSGKHLHHAVVLDEYSAYNLAALDLRPSDALPRFVTADGDPSRVRRFWVIVGTQLSDAAVRLRLLSHKLTGVARVERTDEKEGVTAAKSDGSDGDEDETFTEVENWRAGIVVNARSRAWDRDVFAWYRLDPISDEYASLTPQLERFVGLFQEAHVATTASDPAASGVPM